MWAVLVVLLIVLGVILFFALIMQIRDVVMRPSV